MLLLLLALLLQSQFLLVLLEFAAVAVGDLVAVIMVAVGELVGIIAAASATVV